MERLQPKAALDLCKTTGSSRKSRFVLSGMPSTRNAQTSGLRLSWSLTKSSKEKAAGEKVFAAEPMHETNQGALFRWHTVLAWSIVAAQFASTVVDVQQPFSGHVFQLSCLRIKAWTLEA
eukprot:gb/GFBE01028075.1/.p1 GENE.gb/GFBE01028075.1/~~gb/GFBE01028075.1/.p1  ORF type:complete len:120 (+),score=22.79 gb/GFBE01028075.1/:1-360(+)